MSQPRSIKSLLTPANLVCLLAFSLCSPTTQALPIQRIRPAKGALSIDTSTSSESSTESPSSSRPFITVPRPITIQIDLDQSSDNSASLIERTEQQERLYRLQQQELEELARLEREQDELEREEQDRDQQLDNEEEELEDQDPETRRRRQEEALGLWMTDAEFDAVNQEANSENETDLVQEDGAAGQPISLTEELPLGQSEDENRVAPAPFGEFDLYAEDFTENDEGEEVVQGEVKTVAPLRKSSLSSKVSTSSERFPSEEEMLQWPMINPAHFEDRDDEVQDEYDEQI